MHRAEGSVFLVFGVWQVLVLFSMMKEVTIHQAATQLSQLLSDVEAGEEVLIRRGKTPVARLVGVNSTQRKSRPSVGTITSLPVVCSVDAFAPSFQDWGID
jgi:antitoxin (DNA-binding transcriptional repressor) of toxin-antitoxin stability system